MSMSKKIYDIPNGYNYIKVHVNRPEVGVSMKDYRFLLKAHEQLQNSQTIDLNYPFEFKIFSPKKTGVKLNKSTGRAQDFYELDLENPGEYTIYNENDLKGLDFRGKMLIN